MLLKVWYLAYSALVLLVVSKAHKKWRKRLAKTLLREISTTQMLLFLVAHLSLAPLALAPVFIIQGLLDLAVGRRARGPSAPTAPEQAELFPGADLGRAPERLGPEQGELFPSEDLGRAPERPDERQLDLFATPESEAEAYRQRIRAAQLEKERRVRGPIAPFEEAGPPFFERSDVEAARAGAGLASLLRQRQGELQFEDVPGSRAEQVAQGRCTGKRRVTRCRTWRCRDI